MPSQTERARFAAHDDLGIEQIAATIAREPFAPHAHGEYLIGVTTAGTEVLVQSGQEQTSRPGCLRFINPGEVHSGCAEGGLWSYEAIYVPPTVMASAAGATPRFSAAVVDDPAGRAALLELFSVLRWSSDLFERDSALAAVLALLAARHATNVVPVTRGVEQRAITRVRDYVRAHLTDRITLADLGSEVGLSRFHLLRQFKAATGQTPWQYQTQLRIELARDQMRAGEPMARVAQNCGFVDQSHFTRIFRRVVGVTPGTYAAAVSGSRRRPALEPAAAR